MKNGTLVLESSTPKPITVMYWPGFSREANLTRCIAFVYICIDIDIFIYINIDIEKKRWKPGRASVAVQVRSPKSEVRLLAKFPLPVGRSVFYSVQSFSCLNKAHLYYGGQSALLRVQRVNINLNYKCPHKTSRIMFDQILALWPSQAVS